MFVLGGLAAYGGARLGTTLRAGNEAAQRDRVLNILDQAPAKALRSSASRSPRDSASMAG